MKEDDSIINKFGFKDTEKLFRKYINDLKGNNITPTEIIEIIESVQSKLNVKSIIDELEGIKCEIIIANEIPFLKCPNCYYLLIPTYANFCGKCGTSLKN